MTEPLKILDLFSGIGGFSYAAEHFFQGQFKTTQFVEINPYSQKVLSKNFKGVPIHDNIKTEMKSGKPHKQAVAIAMKTAKMKNGGEVKRVKKKIRGGGAATKGLGFYEID